MSELKAYVCGGWYCEKEAYPKDEADKYIGELKETIAKQSEFMREQINLADRWSRRCIRAERSELHQKYKRCLAMAWWCENGKLIYQYKQRCGDAETEMGLDYLMKRAGWYRKWEKRWLELADKFNDKEAK